MTFKVSNASFFKRLVKTQNIYCFKRNVTQISSNDSFDEKSKQKIIENQNSIFDEYLLQKKNAIGRLSKIEVKLKDLKPFPDMVLLVNKDISTPLDCARHVNELVTQRSIVAKVDDVYWDMNRPLDKDCTISFHHFKEQNSMEVNKIFWRSCSFLLGKIITSTFKDNVPINLHSWPKPNFKTGSFIYDVQLPTIKNWEPTETDLLTLTKSFWNLYERDLVFERLEVPINLAKEIFINNPLKYKQLESIELNNQSSNITLYRVGKFIDFSIGPMIPNTKIIGKVTVSAVHKINSSLGELYRFQGCALPTQLPMHFYAYNLLVKRSKLLNPSLIP